MIGEYLFAQEGRFSISSRSPPRVRVCVPRVKLKYAPITCSNIYRASKRLRRVGSSSECSEHDDLHIT